MSSAFISFLIFSLIYLYQPILSDIHLLLHFILICSTSAAYLVFILVMSMLCSTIEAVVMSFPMLFLAMLISRLNFLRSLSCGLNLYFLFSIFFNFSSIIEFARLSSYGIVLSIVLLNTCKMSIQIASNCARLVLPFDTARSIRDEMLLTFFLFLSLFSISDMTFL